jgi:hypothetical protein
MARAFVVSQIAFLLLACGADSNAGSAKDGGSEHAEVQIGTYDADTLDFVPLAKGGDIPLRTLGQGGTHAALAVRCIGFGMTAWVDVDLVNLDDGSTVSSVTMLRPALLLCRDDAKRVCDDLPFNVMTGGLADPAKKDGLRIRVVAKVHNPAGISASAMQEGVLRKDFAGPVPG